MLVRFTVGNFSLFNEPQTIPLIAGLTQNHSSRINKDSDVKILKFAAIYGANASGKSNLIKAMKYAKDVFFGTEKVKDMIASNLMKQRKTNQAILSLRFFLILKFIHMDLKSSSISK